MVFAILTLIGIFAYVDSRHESADDAWVPDTGPSDVGPREIKYMVSGDAEAASITAATPSGTSQATDRAVPLMGTDGRQGIRFEMEPGDFAYVAAQNEGPSGSITCTIYVNGKVIARNTSDGGYAIASCEGTVP